MVPQASVLCELLGGAACAPSKGDLGRLWMALRRQSPPQPGRECKGHLYSLLGGTWSDGAAEEQGPGTQGNFLPIQGLLGQERWPWSRNVPNSAAIHCLTSRKVRALRSPSLTWESRGAPSSLTGFCRLDFCPCGMMFACDQIPPATIPVAIQELTMAQ